MAMKQTQTKLFDFSDAGLDFCAGSKNLFPDRFKKMLSLGYNEQTVSSVAVAGNQVTLTYGGAHGYAADRVLKVSAPELLSINGGEFVIDSVTENTATMTIDGAPASIAGNFTTKVASLGWELVYEQAHIHIYKFKHIDDSDMYARFCFQNNMSAGHRNSVAVAVGRTIDLSLGHIDDTNLFSNWGICENVIDVITKWDFSYSIAATFNNYSYSQGYSTFGRAMVIGSRYHLVMKYNQGASTIGNYSALSAILPFQSDYETINYPIVIAQNNGASTTTTTNGQLALERAYVGSVRVEFQPANTSNPSYVFANNIASSNFLPASIDNFNTTTCAPLFLYTNSEKQFIGACCGGLYQASYASSNLPSLVQSATPSITYDIDLNHPCITHGMISASSTVSAYLVAPVEEIKIA